MSVELAGRAKNHELEVLDAQVSVSPPESTTVAKKPVPFLQKPEVIAAAKCYGSGMTRSQIARALVEHLSPRSQQTNMEKRLMTTRQKLRRWEQMSEFRDLIFANAVVGLDMTVPAILKGLSASAKKGRVDATRLALEVTGRYSAKGEVAVQQVTLNIVNGVPRPDRG